MQWNDAGPLICHSALNLVLDLKRKIQGHKRYKGDTVDVLRALQNDLWNGNFIAGSTGHFRQCWIRDLCLFSDAYVETGQKERLKKSLSWALQQFHRQNRITTTIWPNGRAYNIFTEPADSLPLIIWTLERHGFSDLWLLHRDFLRTQAREYFETRLDTVGRPKVHRDDAGLKDAVVRHGSSYTFFMAWALAKSLDQFHEDRPNFNWENIFLENFWAFSGFVYEDLDRQNFFSSDVNLIPFWLELISLNDKWRAILSQINQKKLCEPLPIRTSEYRRPSHENPISRFTAPNYQGSTHWANLGMIYLELLRRSGDLKALESDCQKWQARIQKDQNFLEVFDTNGRPFQSWFYSCDEGMNWSVQLLSLLSDRSGVNSFS